MKSTQEDELTIEDLTIRSSDDKDTHILLYWEPDMILYFREREKQWQR